MGLTKRFVGRAIGVAIMTSSLIAGLGVASASAYTVQSGGSYCTGALGVANPGIQGVTGPWNPDQIQAFGHKVYRANCASGNQTIRVTYRVYRVVNGSWAQFYTTKASSVIAPGYGWNAPGFSTQGFFEPMSVDMTIEWWSSNGTYLGWRYVDFNAQSDYVCAASPYPCSTGYLTGLGGYIKV